MKQKNQLKRLAGLLTLPVLVTVSFGANAAEPPPAPVMEAYTCSYNTGKSEKDLLAARDYYVKQADKAGIKLGASYLLSLFKGSLPFDQVWMTPHSSLAAFAAATDAEAASADMAGVEARFDDVVDCTANLNNLMTVFQRQGYTPDGSPGFVSASACTARPGVGPEQLQDLRTHIADVVGSLGADAPNAIFIMTPITQGPTSADMVLMAAFDGVSPWADFITAIRSSADGPMLMRHFQAVAECDQALWNSQRVIAPAAE